MITMPAQDQRRRPALTAEFGTPGDARAAMEALENHGIDGLEITVLDGHGEQGRRSADRRELVYISGRVGKGTAVGIYIARQCQILLALWDGVDPQKNKPGGTANIVVGYGGRVQGTGTFGSVLTQNGGVFAPGASPGTSTTNQLNINGGGTLEFEVANASGTPGLVSGWDLVSVQPTAFNPASANVALSSSSANRYLIQLKSRLDDGFGNTAGPTANFNSASFTAPSLPG